MKKGILVFSIAASFALIGCTSNSGTGPDNQINLKGVTSIYSAGSVKKTGAIQKAQYKSPSAQSTAQNDTYLYLNRADGVEAVKFNGQFAIIDDITYAGEDYIVVKIDELVNKGSKPFSDDDNDRDDNDDDLFEELNEDLIGLIDLKTGNVNVVSDLNFKKKCNDVESFEIIDNNMYFACENNVVKKDLKDLAKPSEVISSKNHQGEKFDDANVVFLKNGAEVIGIYAAEGSPNTIKHVADDTEVTLDKSITSLPDFTFKDAKGNVLFYDATDNSVKKLAYDKATKTLAAKKITYGEVALDKGVVEPLRNEDDSTARLNKAQYFIAQDAYYHLDVLNSTLAKNTWTLGEQDFNTIKTNIESVELDDDEGFVGKVGLAYIDKDNKLKYIKFEANAKPAEITVTGCNKFDDLSIIENTLYFECDDSQDSKYKFDLSKITADGPNAATKLTKKDYIYKVINLSEIIGSNDNQNKEPEIDNTTPPTSGGGDNSTNPQG